MGDNVNHPSHYNSGKFEVIDFIDDQGLNFELGNAVKYISRAGKKDDYVQDLQKAIWYINRHIDLIDSGAYTYLAAAPKKINVYEFCVDVTSSSYLRAALMSIVSSNRCVALLQMAIFFIKKEIDKVSV